MFSVGILTELISELQRKKFKDNAANKGKVYSGGLFSLARHINYGGYTLWRTGLALTSGNYWWAAFQLVLHMYYFTKKVVPELTHYCSNRYGDDWKKFERDVPNILFPYVW
jgi:steroid 5-alpha reductase family enzyme